MDIIGIANPIKDFILVADQVPKQNEFASLLNYSSQGGGKASTALVAAARLGMSCAVVGAVGDDWQGKFVRSDFKRHGINTDYLLTRKEGKTGVCVCLSELKVKNRRFIGARPSVDQILFSELDEHFLKQAKILHLESPDEVSMQAAAFAKKNHILVSMDADPYPEEYERLVEMERMIDILIGSEAYFRKKAGKGTIRDALFETAKKGCRIVGATCGENGIEAVVEGIYLKLPAFRNINVVDTTGAGDTFHGAFLSALLKNKPMEECFRFASAVSAIKCEYLGGRAGIPDWSMTEEFLQKGTISNRTPLQEREHFYKNSMIMEGIE